MGQIGLRVEDIDDLGLKALKDAAKSYGHDKESWHSECDSVLCDVLEMLGAVKTANYFKEVSRGFWYA